MTTMCLQDYSSTYANTNARIVAVREAVKERCVQMQLTDQQARACVHQALSQLRNGVSAASSIVAGCDHAKHLSGRTIRGRQPAGDVA